MAQISTPTAILLGSVIVGGSLGTGVFFGLRQRGPATPSLTGEVATALASSSSTQAASQATSPTAAAGTPRTTGATSPAPAAVVPAGVVQTEITAQLDAARAGLVKRCWEPALGSPGPDHVQFRMHIIVGADGAQLGRSFLEPGGGRPGVAQCLNVQFPPMQIAPPGNRVTLDVPFALP